jgi:hypothetical protein
VQTKDEADPFAGKWKAYESEVKKLPETERLAFKVRLPSLSLPLPLASPSPYSPPLAGWFRERRVGSGRVVADFETRNRAFFLLAEDAGVGARRGAHRDLHHSHLDGRDL